MTVLIDPSDEAQIEFVLEQLLADSPIGMPTETVYGLAARALSPVALARIFELKARPTFDPLIVHVENLEQALSRGLIEKPSSLQERLAHKFWPGPLTILFQKTALVPDLCTASMPFVALRSPEHPVFQKIMKALGEPLAAPSANRFKSISPTDAQAVVQELGPYGLVAVVEGGTAQRGIESTVVKVLSEAKLEIVRQGALSREELASFLGSSVEIVVRQSGSGVEISHDAPGQSEVHYAPQKPLYLLQENELSSFVQTQASSGAALLEVFPQKEELKWDGLRVCLSENRSWAEAASRLFSELRRLDQNVEIKCIVAIACEEESLGAAIMDRLCRAAQKR